MTRTFTHTVTLGRGFYVVRRDPDGYRVFGDFGQDDPFEEGEPVTFEEVALFAASRGYELDAETLSQMGFTIFGKATYAVRPESRDTP